jgi:hypothetical protein
MELIEQYGLFVVFILVIFASSLIGTVMQTAITGIVDLFARIFITG